MTSTIKSGLQVASYSNNYTLQASTVRTVTVTPSDLGMTGNIRTFATIVTTNEGRYNNYFMNWRNYVSGTGVTIYLYSAQARTVPITVTVLYEED